MEEYFVDDWDPVEKKQILRAATSEEIADTEARKAAANDITLVKPAKFAACDALAKQKRDAVVANISPAEMASWPIKVGEASRFTSSGQASDAPNLSAEATARGISLADLVYKVLAKAAALSYLEAQIAGTNGRHNDAINALTDVDAVKAYDFTTGWPV